MYYNVCHIVFWDYNYSFAIFLIIRMTISTSNGILLPNKDLLNVNKWWWWWWWWWWWLHLAFQPRPFKSHNLTASNLPRRANFLFRKFRSHLQEELHAASSIWESSNINIQSPGLANPWPSRTPIIANLPRDTILSQFHPRLGSSVTSFPTGSFWTTITGRLFSQVLTCSIQKSETIHNSKYPTRRRNTCPHFRFVTLRKRHERFLCRCCAHIPSQSR